jgi:zinc protease
MRLPSLFPSTLVAALMACAVAANAADLKLEFEKYQLDNGLEVILSPDRKAPLVTVNVWYHVGSGAEDAGKSGFAHLFEHMMFQGSKHVGSDRHFPVLREVGVSDVNGTTTKDRTNYFETVPANQLETALWLESDRMGYMLNVLDEKSFRNQVDVVRNERRQSYDNVPYGKSGLMVSELLYPAGHPYRHEVIGRHEDLEAASLDDVKAFFRTWYVPANATLTLVGDFEPAEAKKLVAKWFGGFPKSRKPKLMTPPMPGNAGAIAELKDSLAPLPLVTMSWNTPAWFAPGDAELDVAAQILGNEGTGTLYKALVIDKPLAQRVLVGQGSARFSSVFRVVVVLRPGSDPQQVRTIVAEEIAKLKTQAVKPNDLARLVTSFENAMVSSVQGIGGRAETMQSYNQLVGSPDGYLADLARYRKVTGNAVQAAVEQHLMSGKPVVVITQPDRGGK